MTFLSLSAVILSVLPFGFIQTPAIGELSLRWQTFVHRAHRIIFVRFVLTIRTSGSPIRFRALFTILLGVANHSVWGLGLEDVDGEWQSGASAEPIELSEAKP